MDMETVLGGLIIQIGFASAIAYLPLQIYTGLKWRGGWRLAALAPLLLMVPIFAYTAYAYAQQSNLWPIVLIFAAPVGTAYLIVLFVIRHVMNQQPNGVETSTPPDG